MTTDRTLYLVAMAAGIGVGVAYVRPWQAPAPAPAPVKAPTVLAEPQSMGALAAILPEVVARRESAREILYVTFRDGRMESYRPEAWPPAGVDLEGARIIMRKLPDGTWERYDPPPEAVEMAGPSGPDGLITMPEGMRIRYVFTDAGAR